MKRLLALACAAIFSLFAGVEFVLPKEDEFYFDTGTGEGDYYQVTQKEADNYQLLYGQVRGYSADKSQMCDTAPRPDSSRKTEEAWPKIEAVSVMYTPVAPDAPVEEMETTTGIYSCRLTGEANISAPLRGEIAISHYACDYGRRMDYLMAVGEDQYMMSVSDAKCWYCCAHKPAPEDPEGRYTATSETSLKGQVMSAGDILCVGKAGTTITITKL